MIFFLSSDARRFHSPLREIKNGEETLRNIYFSQEHFLYIQKTAIQKRKTFNSIIYYDPASDAPQTDSKIVAVTDRSYKEISLVETDSVRDPFVALLKYIEPGTRVSLIYFGHSLISPYQYSSQDLFPHSYDESSPKAPFRLSQFAQEIKKTGIRYESISFFSCRMSSIEVLTALSPYTDYVLANAYPTSHKAWWASFTFMEELHEADTTEEMLRKILFVNRLNSQKNLQTGRYLRASHHWNYFRLSYVKPFNQALEEVWQYIYRAFIAEKRFQDLADLMELSKPSGNWEKHLMEGIDLGKFLLNLSISGISEAPSSVKAALDLMITPEALLAEPYNGKDDSG
ncbi:MAG: hypothetical protein AAB309_05075, partial [Deltaproteobacteria bacterium]